MFATSPNTKSKEKNVVGRSVSCALMHFTKKQSNVQAFINLHIRLIILFCRQKWLGHKCFVWPFVSIFGNLATFWLNLNVVGLPHSGIWTLEMAPCALIKHASLPDSWNTTFNVIPNSEKGDGDYHCSAVYFLNAFIWSSRRFAEH